VIHSRNTAFAVVVAVCVLVGGGFVVFAALRENSTTSEARVGVGSRSPVAVRGELMVRAVDPSDARLNGLVTKVRLGGDAAARGSDLACQRVYYSSGRGLCLALSRSGVDYTGKIFDKNLRVIRQFALSGLPSRARVSGSGRLGSVTTFVAGDSYVAQGQFSTRTNIIDMRSGRTIADLETFAAYRGGSKLDAPDINYWGVTFADDENRFYATLATGDHHYLVHGALRDRRVRVIRDNVECPSLSPDGTRLAYKRRVDDAGNWRLHVLELETMRDTALAERRSIDDQAEWLDNDTVVYGDGQDVWAVRADGGGSPRRILRRASSPARLG
jgi:hypothetical protein